MNNTKKIEIILILLVLPFFISGCTANDLVGFVVGEEIKEETPAEEEIKEETPAEEEMKEEEKLDPEGAMKAEQEQEKAEQEKAKFEQEKAELESQLKELEEKIDNAANTIAKKEVEAVKKSSGENAATSTKKKRAKQRLEELKEEQEKALKERTEDIKSALLEEAKLVQELDDLGETIIPTEPLQISLKVSEDLIAEAKKLIESKVDIESAISKLTNVLDRGPPSMRIKAGARIIDAKLDALKEAKYPERIKELEKLADQIVDIAQSFAKEDMLKALSQKMKVEIALNHVGGLSETAGKMLSIEPSNIGAKTMKAITDSILKRISTEETLAAIKEVKRFANLQDKEISIELRLYEVNMLLKTGKRSDVYSAKNEVSVLVPLIRSKEITKGEDIFKELGISRSELARTFEVILTDSGPKVIHGDREVTDKRVKSNAFNRLKWGEKILLYSYYPTEYMEASTYDEGYQQVDGEVYLFDSGKIYRYEFIGKNEQIRGDKEKSIRNAVFHNKVESGLDIPLTQKLMPEKISIYTTPIQKAKKFINRFFFLQVRGLPTPYFVEGTYSYTSCKSNNQCNWPSTCNNEICCLLRDDGGCDISRIN